MRFLVRTRALRLGGRGAGTSEGVVVWAISAAPLWVLVRCSETRERGRVPVGSAVQGACTRNAGKWLRWSTRTARVRCGGAVSRLRAYMDKGI